MSNPEKQDSADDRKVGGSCPADQSEANDFNDLSDTATVESVQNSTQRGGVGLADRLTDVLVDQGDGDLLLQQSDREVRVLQWLQALDIQVMGACRADERLKPLLKLNILGGAAEDRLLAHMSQHFEPSEVGKLARCLCVPLVSIRVGKIIKRGSLMCPSSIRGNLNLTLLPASYLRISFVGDDCNTERMCTLTSNLQCTAVAIQEINADNSGRSFLIKSPDGQFSYFWCSEKSERVGVELLGKMKDLLKKMPSLTELTGISESRLECFATHLRAYLVGPGLTKTQATSIPSVDSDSPPFGVGHHHDVPVPPSNSNSLYQGSFRPSSSSSSIEAENPPYSLRSSVREELPVEDTSESDYVEGSNHSDVSMLDAFSPSNLSESADIYTATIAPGAIPGSRLPSSMSSSLFSPYYCWCPPCSSTLQYTIAPLQLPFSSSDSLSIPSFSPLLPAPTTGLLIPTLNSGDFPALLPDPMVHHPLSISSSQQIQTFTPLICDPIVHLPVLEVCSSGQVCLVSGGPAISTTISPLHPQLVGPLISETNSVLERGARETLRRLLMGGSGQNGPGVFVDGKNLHNVGSRGVYDAASDVADGFGSRCGGSCSDPNDPSETRGGGGVRGTRPEADDEGMGFSGWGQEEM